MNKYSIAKSCISLCALLLVCVILGTAALTAAYMLPAERVELQVRDSVALLELEGLYPRLVARTNTRLDNYTDALMLQTAVYSGPESALQQALLNKRTELGKDDPLANLIAYCNDEPGGDTVSYARYWHGYLVFLRPALEIFNLREIRIFNAYTQLGLGLLCLWYMKKRGMEKYLLPFVLLLLMQCPFTTGNSLQYSTVFYVYLLSSLAVLVFYDALRSRGWLPYLFCFTGIATAYLDLLTYPAVSFAVPLVLCILQEKGEIKQELKTCVILGLCWAFGYGGMWAAKWVVASVLSGENIIMEALATAQYRIGGDYGGNSFSVPDAWRINLTEFIKNPAALAALAITVAAPPVKKITRGGVNEHKTLLLISLLPLLWYAVLTNHSCIHGWIFTWRELLISGFALSCWALEMLSREKQ